MSLARSLLLPVFKPLARGLVKSGLYSRILKLFPTVSSLAPASTRPVQQGQVCEFDGVDDYISAAHLTGSETVTSSVGTSTPSISAGRIDFTAGKCSNLILSDGTQYNLNHASGTTAYDSSGNGNDGTLQNGAAFVVDNTLPPEADKLNLEGFSRRMLFDGVNDFVDLGASFLNVSGAEIRITAKIEVGGNPRVIVSQGGATGGWVVNTDTNNKLRIVIKQNGSTSTYRTILSSVVLSEGQIYDIDVKFSQDTATVIINGVEDASVNIGSPVGVYGDSVSNVFIGARGDNSLWWEGLIFDCNLYLDDVLLSSCNGYGNTDADWTDQSGNGNDGTVNGSPENLLLPRDESDPTNDIFGNPLQYSGSVYPRRPEYRNSYAASFDGVDDKILIDGTSYASKTKGKITGYFKTTASGVGTICAFTDESDTASDLRILINSGRMMLGIRNNSSNSLNASTVSTFNDGAWHSFVVSCTDSGITLTVDGDVQAVTYAVGNAATVKWINDVDDVDMFAIGVRQESSPDHYFNGEIAGITLFDEDGTTIIAQYPLTEGAGDTAHDISGNGNHGTINNASTATEGAGFWAGRIDGEENALNNNNGFSKRMLFDGVDGFVDIFDNETVSSSFQSLSDDITIEANIFRTASGGYDPSNWRMAETVCELRQIGTASGTAIPFSFGINSNRISLGVTDDYTRGAEQSGFGSTTLSLFTPYSIKVVISGDNYEFFLNGVSDGSGTLTTATGDRSVGSNASSLTIGSRAKDNGVRDSNMATGIVWGVRVSTDSGGTVLASYNGYGNTDADWTDQSGNSNNGTVNGSPALLRIPADTSDPTLDVFGDTLTNPAITDGYNGAETELDAYNIAEDGNPSPATNNNPDLESIEFGADFASNDAAFMRLKSSTENDRLITFADDLTGDDKELVEKFTETP